MSNLSVAFDRLGHAYRHGHWVFRHYRGEVAPGQALALLGPNGRGKTTLLKILLGVLQPTEGWVKVHGQTAFVPQLFQVSFDYTALDMVLMGRARKIGLLSQPSREDADAALAALDRFGLADIAEQPFQEMSGGQRQLVVLARALVADANILVLDEPTSALDLKNQGLVLEWIDRLAHRDGLTVIFTTHHPHHAQAVADSALLMIGENEYVSGSIVDVLTEDNLHRLYGVELRHVSFEHRGVAITTLVPVYSDLHRPA
jgi:iron complex transport system ATP-binding protein